MPSDKPDPILRVADVQRFSMHDGPGLRTVVFLKGCPLRCRWCHNPESQSEKIEIRFVASRCIGCGVCVAVCPRAAQRCAPEREIDRARCIACGTCAGACPAGALEIVGRDRAIEDILDDGYVDMKRAMAIYKRCGFDGTVVPDHTPRLDAADWWETGMAFALGYIRGIMP